MQYTAENLLIHPPSDTADPDLILSITPETAGWQHLSFQARRLGKGRSWSFETGEHELALVNLSGRYAVRSRRGNWSGMGGRKTVFAGAAHVLYLPRRTAFTVTAEEDGEFAAGWAPADRDREPFLIRPEQTRRYIRGGDNASRQINDLLPPGSLVDRLVLVEVYTPSGNWSSYPPHKHDIHVEDDRGNVIEADLEEVYFYKFDKPEGYAYHRVYTEDEIKAAMLTDPALVQKTQSVSDTPVRGDVEAAARAILALGPKALLQKRGEKGAVVHVLKESGGIERLDAPGFPVQVYNILGAGDAFAAGFLYGRVHGWSWYKAARLGNACGAIVVTKHGCANFMPTLEEVLDFVKEYGGLE
ncbi:MAG: 5-deoxy-glucuronate isomerase [Planctomycetes bacterium]|nr:5-deoxy-glucuronate isomerase [Planctomycetota bacterium]